MKSSIKLFAIASILIFIAAGCSKEKRIERRLARESGKWNIELYETNYYEDGVLTGSYAYTDYGNFVFDDDGTVVETNYDNGTTYTYAGTWSNTDQSVTIIENGDVFTFKIIEESRKEMVLEYTDSYEDVQGIDHRDVFTMHLEKDK